MAEQEINLQYQHNEDPIRTRMTPEFPTFEGLHWIWFIGQKSPVKVNLVGAIMDMTGRPIIPCADGGRDYNYSTVISTERCQ